MDAPPNIGRVLFREFKKHGMPETWNYLLRPIGVYGGGPVAAVTLTGLAATKGIVEHVGIKAPFYVGKAAFRGCIELHNLRTGAGITPATHGWCPNMGNWNF